MNQEQAISLLRQMLFVAAGGLVTKGYVDSGTLNIIIGAVVALATSAWSIYTRRNSGLILSAAAVPKVDAVVMSTATAAKAVPSDKVVGPGVV